MTRNNQENTSGTKFNRYGVVLRKYLKGTKTKQKKLAEYAGLSEPSISDYCKGIRLPKPHVHELILEFIDDQAVRDELHSQFQFFTPESFWIDDVLELCSNVVEGVYSLAVNGFILQAISQAREHLEISIDHKLRHDLEVSLFMLLIVQSDYAQAHELALSVAKDDLHEKVEREFRSVAMRGIAGRSLISHDYTAPFDHLRKAFDLAHSAPTLIRPEHFMIVERMLGLQIVDLSRHFNDATVKDVLRSFETRLISIGNGVGRADTIEAISRCHLRLQNFSDANDMLNEISSKDQFRVLTLEERIQIIRARIHELNGELEEALNRYKEAIELCTRKHNLHHKKFAEMGAIRVNEMMFARS